MTEALFTLNRASSRTVKGSKAPHKPVLLLALIQEVDEGRIKENRFTITPDLLATFRGLWSQLVEGNWSCKIYSPFYHMTNDKPGFWFIKT